MEVGRRTNLSSPGLRVSGRISTSKASSGNRKGNPHKTPARAMSNESQPEAKRQRIEEQDDHLTTTTAKTNTDRKMAEETSKMEAEATAEGEFLSCLWRRIGYVAAGVGTCHFWRMHGRMM